MSEPITPRELREQTAVFRLDLHTALERALDLLTTELYGTLPSHAALLEHPPAARRDHHLARLAAIDTLTEELGHLSRENAFAAGQVDGAPATYADLGAAVGLSREGARSRFPGAVPDAKPGRPRKQVTVLFTGGPDEWDGYRMEYPASTLEGDLDTVGAYLVVDAIPEGVPANARAHYAPTSEDTRTVWVFQGWLPSPTS